MSVFMRNKDTGIFLGPIDENGPELEVLRSVVSTADGRPLYEDAAPQEIEGVLGVNKLEDSTFQSLVKYIDALAAGVDTVETLGVVAAAGNVTRVEYIPDAAINGAATNTRTLNLLDVGQERANAGTPTTIASEALVAGVVLPADEPFNIAITAAPVAEGDVLEWQSLHGGTGLADPGGVVIVTLNMVVQSPVSYG